MPELTPRRTHMVPPTPPGAVPGFGPAEPVMQYFGAQPFANLVQAGVQQAAGTVGQDAQTGLDVLNDPRNAWIGTNPVGRGVMESLAALKGLAALGKLPGKPTYLPPNYHVQEMYTDMMPLSYHPRGVQGGNFFDGDRLMQQGLDPHGPGFERTWALMQDGEPIVDYMPPAIKSQELARRWAQQWIGKHTLDPYGPTDTGTMGTPRRLMSDEFPWRTE